MYLIESQFPSWIPGEADLICAKFDYYYHRHFDGYSELILNRTENYKYDPRRERLQGINMIVMKWPFTNDVSEMEQKS